MMGELKAAMFERVARIAEIEMARAGKPHPGLSSCWLFFGREGRQESLSSDAPVLGLIYSDAPESGEEGQAKDRTEAEKYFSTLAQKVGAKLEGCGFRPQQPPRGTPQGPFCRSFSGWKKFYGGLIRDPIVNAIYGSRDFFDARVVCGDPALWQELWKRILEELRRNDAFIPVLANDTLSELPPLTFFQGFVIEPDGARRQTLDLEKTAVSPIVDAARVFALAAGEDSAPNTLRRLDSAAKAYRPRASLFMDAADGLRIASYQHAVARFTGRNAGASILPSKLTRFEQRLLKTCFDSVRRLIELTSTVYD
jgi:CBS domain-containing protein